MPKQPHHRKSGGAFKGPQGAMPEVTVLLITTQTPEGELVAEPAKWAERKRPPHIIITDSGRNPAAKVGDRVLAKLRKIRPQLYQGLVIRVLPSEAPEPVLGVFVPTATGGFIEPISRKNKETYIVLSADTLEAQNGELVAGISMPEVPSSGMSYARITERLGRLDAPKAASLIATHMHNLPSVFSAAAIEQSENAPEPTMEAGRKDLRDIPLVTIDGADARDFDDAVFAEPDDKHEGGWHIVVAIADVAYYVTPESALDGEASQRGNSVYFPDRVIPMLPERLSNGLCSLRPDEDRYCLAVHMWIDSEGNTKKYNFVRGLMRSRARLTYEQVALAKDELKPDVQQLVTNLEGAYKALAHERDKRGSLNLNLPEYKIIFDSSGNVANITPKAPLESHRLIEAFMIAANVAAADYLIKHKLPGIYRAHEAPSAEKLEDLHQLLQMAGYPLSKGAGLTAHQFNRVLKRSEGSPEQHLIHTSVLRSQMQAFYSEENIGHFGLSLPRYCHFTSPIRRYADLVVHRSLVAAIAGEKPEKPKSLASIALHISGTERKAMLAERDASDRYKVSFMSRQLGSTFMGTITGLNEYGLFVSLTDNGVTGFVPIRNLPGDFYLYDKRHAKFFGQRTRRSFTLGQEIVIRVQEANAMTGSLIFQPEAGETSPEPRLRPKKHGGHHGGHKRDGKERSGSHKEKQGKFKGKRRK